MDIRPYLTRTNLLRGGVVALLFAVLIFLLYNMYGGRGGGVFLSPDHMQRAIMREMRGEYMYRDGRIESEPGWVRSESQSYGMLIAVLADDQPLFDRTWEWTKARLRMRGDALFAWLWADGTIQDSSSASDADEDIALALIAAHARWGEERYRDEAKAILNDFWAKNTKEVGGIRYVTGGDWALHDNEGITLNPSYFAPSWYRIFARIDPVHDWNSLVESSYQALESCTSEAGLAPNWCRIDNEGNVVRDYHYSQPTAQVYSYDALRVPFRIALDAALFDESRAVNYLKKNTVFKRDWVVEGRIYSIYELNGTPQNEAAPAASATALAQFHIAEPLLADELWEQEIRALTKLQGESFYNLAWLWFGLEFYKNGWTELGAVRNL